MLIIKSLLINPSVRPSVVVKSSKVNRVAIMLRRCAKQNDADSCRNYRLSTFMTMRYGRHGEGLTKTTITTITTPVLVARGGRERSNPAKTTTALRDVRPTT